MRCIAITLPDFVPGEAAAIEALLASGVLGRVHIRKPAASREAIQRLIEAIDARWHNRLSLHDWHELASDYGCGVHLNGRHPLPPTGFSGTLSRSCHAVAELSHGIDYQTLSPIFNSISKPGYDAAFDLAALRGVVDDTCVALGGVTPHRLPLLADVGFGGAAFVGYLWTGDINNKIRELYAAIHHTSAS